MIQGEIWRVLLPTGDEGTCAILGRITATSPEEALQKAQRLWPQRATKLVVQKPALVIDPATPSMSGNRQ